MSVAFVREESAAAAQEVSLPPRAISAHPNLVTQSGLRALERALADSQQALKAAQAIIGRQTSAVALWNSPHGMRAISRNASRARFRSLSRQTRSSLCSAPGHDPARRRPPPDVPDRRRGRGGSPRRIDRLCVPACPSAHWKAGR